MGTFIKMGVWLLVVIVAGCASPGRRLEDRALELGLLPLEVTGKGYVHQAYRNRAGSGKWLHVYLEGDGSPWLNRWTVAPDPTPRRPLMLELLVRDPSPAVYLGRPCYHDRSRDPGCHPWLWTAGRYSPTVVNSLEAAVETLLQEGGYTGVVLLGHSGGGVLAMLLAGKLPQVKAVVTVAANLDVDRWTEHHDYSPLKGSLNPARRPPLEEAVVQMHLAGGGDRNVPPALTRAALAGQPDGAFVIYDNFDHHCCWTRIWPGILQELEARLSSAGPTPGLRRFPGL